MHFKCLLFVGIAMALAAEAMAVDDKTEDEMEDSTMSPVTDLATLDSEIKTSTEKPTTAAEHAQKAVPAMKSDQTQNARPQTVADFIIHPLIAFKPRSPENDLTGRQSGDAASTTPSPWTLFGFNAGQGLGSSVSSLAGSVGGWFTDRIQLPGLVDSPVRQSTTTSTTTTTTTTPRPDVIVRVQQKPPTRSPLISITNDNRPNRFPNNNNLNFAFNEGDDEDLDDEFEEEEEEEIVKNKNKRKDDKNQSNRRKPNQDEEDSDDEDDEEEEEDEHPVRVSQPKRPQNQRRRRPAVEDELSEEDIDNEGESNSGEHDDEDEENIEDEGSDENVEEEGTAPQFTNLRRASSKRNNNNRSRLQPHRRRLSQQPESEEVADDDADEHFYYGRRPSTKRSQQEATLFQRGQESIINQLRQLTRGRTPAEVGALVRKSPKQAGSKKKRRQHTTLLVNRNGQTIYLAPELLNVDLPLINQQVQYTTQDVTQYPQPPLTVPLKRKNAPTQYITIPWSQLGISPPERLHSVTEGIQSQPLILNIPASAIQTMENQSFKRKKQPVLTAAAVPLLAEASIMDIFKPPTIPHDREAADTSAEKPISTSMPVIIASKKKPVTTVILPQRIRPGTVVEKAPESADNSQQEDSDEASAQETVRKTENKYIIVGEDNEADLTRKVNPVYGEARYVYGSNGSPYLELLKSGLFAVRRSGRKLDLPEGNKQAQLTNSEQLIPVQIISEPKEDVQPVVETQPQPERPIIQSEQQVEVQQKPMEDADVPVNVAEENKSSEPMAAA